ncbi:MAG: family 20 glycosylhydrolase [Saprospiraceae bacterium]
MQTITQTLILLSVLSFIIGCADIQPPQPMTPQLIPQPVSLKTEEGSFEITKKTIVAVSDEEQQKVAELFFNHFKKVAGWSPDIEISQKGDIVFNKKEGLKKEAYELDITADKIIIQASDGAGCFYALQTMRQLLPTDFTANELQKETRWVLPLVKITDEPRFGWRGFMLDVSRHFYEKKYVLEILDQMAALKLNTFHWHLTDDQGWRIEIKKYPKLTEVGAWRVDYNDHDENHNRWWGRPVQRPTDKATYGGFYTQAEIKEVIKYAAERYITVVPELDMPGHSQATIAAYPEIACHPGPYFVATGGVFKDNTLCPGKEITFEFVENILNEIMDLFPSKYIHIGGDECNKEAWKIDGDCQNRIKKEGLKNENELQSYFIKRVEKIINARGRNLIGWDEILEGGLAPNATVMSWRGEEGGIAAAQEDHHVVMAPSKYCYLDLKQGHTDHEPNFGYAQCLLSSCYNYNPVPESLKDKSKYVLGMQGNLWSESLPDWDKATYMAFPRLFAIAENAWSLQEKENWDEFIERLYPQLNRLEIQKIRYAKSAFNVWINHRGNGENIIVDLFTEANGLEIKYTLDGSLLDTNSNLYTKPFVLNNSAMVKAAAFKNGRIIGKITQKEFFVHKAKSATVVYHTPFQENKTAGGKKALIDLNYGSNWTVDSLWQGFYAPQIELDVIFNEPVEVETVRMNFLQVAISGLYMPEFIEILGSSNGADFKTLGELSLLEKAKVQGRYIQPVKIDFPKTAVKILKIKAKTVNPIYEGHHRQGEQSRVFLDEIVVF